MKPPKFYRKFNYDKSLLPNKYLASMEQGISTIEEAKAKTGLSIGYPGWCLIYYVLLSHLNPEGNNLIVETGTNQGWTTIILAQALRDSNGRGKIYTVELDQENYKIALANFQQAGVADLIKAINGDSKIALKEIVNKYDSVKVAFLDASHLFDDVIAEFEIILPALGPQSLVVFDNTYSIAEEHEDQRVNGALKEILKRHGGNLVNLEFVSWYTPGVAIWQKSPFDSLKIIEANNKSKHINNITPQSDSKKSQNDMMRHSQEELKLWEILQELFSTVEYSDFKRALECIALIDKQIIGRHCGDLGDKLAQYLAIIQFFRKSGVEGADSLEIGTLFGGSCLIKLMAMRDLNVGGKIICIDPMEGYYGNKVDPYSGLEVKTDILFSNLDIFGFSKEAIELKRMPSNENQATAGLVEGAYATLMIDGDHSYQGVRYDWDQYNKFVSKGGFILLDDYAEPAWPDITKFVRELIGTLQHDWDVIGQIGTTFLLKKNTNSIEVDLLANHRRTFLPEEVISDSKALLARYKDKHRGQRCVIIGNGPSLNEMDLSFLKDEITFGMNRIYLMFDKYNFRPTYYVSVNPLVIEQSIEDILKIQAPKFLALNALPYVQDPRGIAFLKSTGRPSFSKDLTNGLWEGYTVTYVAMQLAYFMGFSEVILIGVDHHFTTPGQPNQEVISGGNDPNHFHPDYFGKGTRWNLPDLKNSEIAYRLAKQAFDADGRRIIDATADGKLTIFPKEDYKDLFKRYRKIDLEKKGQLAEISFLNKQGEGQFIKGEIEAAYNTFVKVIERAPNFATAHNNLGVLCYSRGNKDNALSHYQEAARLQPENITFQKNLADFYYVDLGRVEEAMQIYVKVLNANPEDIETLLIIGHICVAMEKFDDAKDFYSRVLKIEPGNKDAREFIKKVEKCQLSAVGGRLNLENSEEDSKEFLVSAIVSTYNSERFIRGCLEDLENQTIADRLEIVVVNSGSEHNEDKIIKEFQEKYSNIKYIKTDKRETVYAAWNRGIKAATGKYITNANTDDRHRKDAFEVMINMLETQPEMALVYADVIITETENETFENCTPVGYFNWMDWKREDLLNKGCFMGPQPMWRRDVHDEYGYFDDSFVTSGDYEFWLRISQTNAFLHLPVRLGLYLRSTGSIEHLNREEQREENNKIFKMYSESNSSGKNIRRIETDLPQISDKKIDERREFKLKALNPDIQVSIIMPTSGQQKYIKKCLESIEEYISKSYEIVFVDNGVAKGTRKWLNQSIKENSHYIMTKCPKDVSFAGQYNEGIKASKGEYILLLSNDVVVTKDWLDRMLECLQSTPDAGIVGPMSNVSRGTQRVLTADNLSTDQLDGFAESFMNKNRNRRIPTFSIDGFCMLFRRDLVEEIGFFDEQFGQGGCEDEDFCLRALMEGRKNIIAGDVYVHRQNKKTLDRNKKYFNQKWNKGDTQSPSGKKFLTLTAIEKGCSVYQRGYINNAVEILLEGIGLSPDDKQPYYALAEILLHAKNHKDAIDILNEMPQDEQDEKRLELLGYCKEGMDNDNDAQEYTDRILSINGKFAQALNLKGILAFKQGDIKSAEDYFNRAIESDPGYGESYTNLGAILWDSQPEEALDLFEKGFILSPTITDILTNYHSAITASGEFGRAAQVFEEASLLYPNNKMIKYQLIDLLIKQEKNAEAMNQIEEAIALCGVDDGVLSAALKIRDLFGPIEIDETKDKKDTLSLCMIVKNEEEYLARCLKSVKPVVDEMIVIDTGSDDRTIEIARAFGAKVYNFKWTGDFSEARNFSLSKASGNWAFHLDADEVISSLDYEAFRKAIRQSATKKIAFLINTRNYTMDVNQVGWTANDGHYEKEESASGWTPSEKVRLFRNESNTRFEYPIHELVEPSLKRAGITVKKSGISVHHYGKLNKEKSSKKVEVYYQIGRKKLDETKGDAVAIRELAIQAEIIKKHDEAIELWERFNTIEPNVPEAYINMGISYCSLGKYEKVLETAKKAMKLAPDMKEAHYNYALGKLHLGSAAEAVSILEKLFQRLGEYPPAQFLSAAAYCCSGEKEKGIKVLKQLQKTSIGPGLPIRCHELAKGFISCRRNDYALMLLEAAIDSKISNKDVLKLYSQCLKVTGDNEIAGANKVAIYKNLKNTDNKNDTGNKKSAMDILQQAGMLNQKGQIDNSIEMALKAIRQFPGDKQPYYVLAEILLNANKYKDAFDVLNEMPQDEKDVRRLEMTGYCKEGMKQYDEARDYANQALSLNPSSAAAMNLKGVLVYNQGDNNEAEDFFKQAIGLDPEYGEPYTNLGVIRLDKNQDEALNLFEKGFILSPTIPDIITNYHSAASALEEFERAESIFKDAGLLYPNNKMIKYQLIDMLIKQEKNAEAMHRIEEAIALFGVNDGILSAALKIRDSLGPKEIDKIRHKKNTVSLCMIVKNEEKHLARCVNSMKSIVDEMIVVDTGSTDRTRDIAKVFGAKVYDFEWNDDFSEARNISISKASGKWNLIMDADETISSLDYNKFKKIIEKSKQVAYQFTTRNYTLLFNMIGWSANDEKYIDENAGVGWTPSDKVRLFPNEPGVRFEYPIHELIEPSLKKTGIEVKKCKIPIHHYGKLNQKKSDDKDELYYQIGRKKLDEMGDDEVALCELAIQAETLGKHEESIELWERLIKIKPETALAFVNMGTAYAKLGKYEKAVSAASKALEIDPEMVEAHYNYAFAKVHLGQVKEAALILEKLLSRFSEYPPAQFLLSVAYCLEARGARWWKGFEKLRLTMGPGLAVACHEFAKGLVSAQRPDYAVTLLEAAIESKNSNKEIDELYSKCLEMMNVDGKTGTMGDL